MPWHDVVQGEDIITIAREYNIENWETIWDHPQNARLRSERQDPYVLAPDDRVFVPDYRGLVYLLGSGARHDIVVGGGLLRYVRLALADSRNNPYPGRNFTLTVGNETVEGVTTQEGAIEVALPEDATSADLTLYPRSGNTDLKFEWRMQLGYLNPIRTISGVKARLRNLGYNITEINDSQDAQLGDAVELFRARHSIPVNRTIDDDLRERLRLAHGGT